MNRQLLYNPLRWLIIGAGAVICVVSALNLKAEALDTRFLFLTILTVTVASRITVRMPSVNGRITISETFIFLTMLLYGGEAAVLLAAAEGVCASVRMVKKPANLLLNGGVMAASTFLTVWALRSCFGPIINLPHSSVPATYVSALCVMALVQYVVNTGLAAAVQACKMGESVWHTWSKYCLWSSITYLAGAPAAYLIVKLIAAVGFSAVMVSTPIIGILYLTYRTYLKNIEVMAAAAKAEAAAAAEAEASAAQAEQARRHIEELSHYIAEQERISQALKESKDHFRHAAFHDALTGLPNRMLITDNLRLALERAHRCAGYHFAVLFLDLDRFKNVNDSLGHTVGDELLVAIARRLEAGLRPADMVARLGGDEFAILLDGISGVGDATGTAERIQEALSAPFSLRGHEVFTTTSVGIALGGVGYESPEDILRDADIAMYRAKDKGKACHEVFAASMYTRAVTLMQMENDLRRALEREELRVHYQPVVSLTTGRISGFEALVRWQHPERGMVPPGDFIPMAEETGLILPLGLWVLREACRQVREWQGRSPMHRALTLSVNLSGKQFMQPDLVEHVEDVLRETDFDPRCLQLEITESVLMDSAESAVAMLEALRAIGARVSIDDFGTGYSSLSYLHRFPINTLKIDRSFVGRMGPGVEKAEIVRTIVTLARNLGMEVVAEGVETLDQSEQLRALECDYAQGYLYSKPVSGEAAGALLAKRSPWHLSYGDVPGESYPATALNNVRYLKFA
ncbi:MAG TPA: EAL domain-containing protein [Pyrinomonadaceae bacterium]|nr:EAL domain-containing protein [Pyrinomonadaceae bacterium]